MVTGLYFLPTAHNLLSLGTRVINKYLMDYSVTQKVLYNELLRQLPRVSLLYMVPGPYFLSTAHNLLSLGTRVINKYLMDYSVTQKVLYNELLRRLPGVSLLYMVPGPYFLSSAHNLLSLGTRVINKYLIDYSVTQKALYNKLLRQLPRVPL